jgi:hypothetical protein
MVTTAMTAATPTTMPTNVSAVRSLLARRLAKATRNDSHKAETRSRVDDFKMRRDEEDEAR